MRAAQCPNLLLLVYESLKVTREDFGSIPGELIFFKEKPVIKDIMAAVEALADKLYGPLEKPEKKPKPGKASSKKAEAVEHEQQTN